MLALPFVDGLERGKTADAWNLDYAAKGFLFLIFFRFGRPSPATRDLFLEELYIFCRSLQYDVTPKSRRLKPLAVRPNYFHPKGESSLPTFHDTFVTTRPYAGPVRFSRASPHQYPLSRRCSHRYRIAFAVSTSRALVVAVASTVPSSEVNLPATKATVLPNCVTFASPVIRPTLAGLRKLTVMVMVAV